MKHLVLLGIVLISVVSLGQGKSFDRAFLLPKTTPFTFSYFGNLGIHPGGKLGFEYTLFFKEKQKENKRRTKTIRKTLILAPSVAFYSHQNSHQGLYVSADLIWRRYTKRLYIIDFSLGLGHYTRFNSGTTYRVTSTKVETIKNANIGYFSPSFSSSFGKRLRFVEAFPCDVFFKNTYHVYTNFNSLIGNDMSFEIGVRMNLNKGIKQDIIVK